MACAQSSRVVTMLAAVGMLVAAGCGGASATRPATGTARVKKITIMLNYIAEGYHAPFYVAQEKGYYRAQGLDVHIEPSSSGSRLGPQNLASGVIAFAVTNPSAVIAAVNKGIPIKMVACYIQKNPMAFIFLKKRHITKPRQIRGMTIGDPAGTESRKLLPAFLQANGLSTADVRVESVAASALQALLAKGKIDTYPAFAMTQVPVLQRKGIQVSTLSWADYGVQTLELGVAANDRMIKSSPGEIRGFLKATAQGYRYAEQHPHQAVSIMRGMLPKGQVPQGYTQTLQLALKLIHTQASKGHPIGWMAPADWSSTLGIEQKYEHLKNAKPIQAYYTDAFVQTATGG